MFEGNSENQYPLWIVEAKRGYDKQQDEHTHFQLLQCIKHHNSIIKFAQELEEVISPVMFFQFIATALEICFAGFQAKLVSDWGPNFFKCVMYTLANILQTFCYCRFGEGIINESNNFALAVYNNRWYEESTKFKFSVKMVLMRSQKPLQLVAGKFYTVSLESFARLLNMSYSFLTILQQVNE
ncbi:hypothetical protein R5R35_003738 [Gryllus longicercus]|uniref:Odorant receptor n=1 Tax=Gryllus longicercus TaxID=2509291 RepID=A0AAN9V6Y0_9ORTH